MLQIFINKFRVDKPALEKVDLSEAAVERKGKP